VIFSVVTSFVLAVAIGPRVIDNLLRRQIGQTIREEGVQEHKKKAGIPTMGGIIFLIPIVITTLAYTKFNVYVFIALFLTLGMGLLGLLDDLTKVIKARSLGLTPRQKLFGQVAFALIAALVLRYYFDDRLELPVLDGVGSLFLPPGFIHVPFFGAANLQFMYIPFLVVVIVGATNAVNLTDGLDGLAAGTVSVAIIPFMVIAYVIGNSIFSRHLGVAFIPGTGELAIFCAALLGGCLGFLWFNSHPAEVFMGDTGSLALGGAISAVAVCTRTELFLLIIGGLFVSEALSVIVQVTYFKYSHGKRIFLMSPIHHHFELAGWAEEKVVARFWIVSLILALAGLAIFAARLIVR